MVSTKFLFLPPASFQVVSPDWATRVLTEDRTLDAPSLDMVGGSEGGDLKDEEEAHCPEQF